MNSFFRHRLFIDLQILAGYALLVAGVAACTIKAEEMPATETSAPAFTGIPVDAMVVKPGVVSDELVVTGSILANQQVSIVSELTRKVTKVNVKEGSKVRKGTLLFQLDNSDLLAQLEKLRQQEKLALLNEGRLKDLLEKEAIAQQDYDEASTNLKVLQAQIQELLTIIDKTRIVAPFDGQVGIINTYPGAVVSTNTVLANIEDNSVVKVDFSIPEKYSNTVSVGSEQSFTTPSDEKVYKARITAKAASLDTDTRSLLVRGVSPNPEGKLLPGQSARITLSLKTSPNALAISSHALIPSPGGYVVFVSKNKKAQLQPIEIGQRSTGSIEIVKGLTAGDTVITSNLLRLAPGTQVNLLAIK
ncbi:efflux RND transporter periplasmic adaptor subunit [Chryseosolibacter indicus]|uniref:Efflux RND transporter periplasmic adaptor subunit n=1 Tax=Chryseosolibacter indicus TaxID=2782351 RepID=A0ABS5VQG2_9BACT|nr:efflux RND transporter periplasmic adaptor subunit [Chryseosolibacter indicus]MBT1703675.1 efflux RND transporter periplasmic adaptor subunit [Chryseosolibacter indicus]